LVPKPGKDDACDSVREEIEQLEDELDKDLAKLERKTRSLTFIIAYTMSSSPRVA
jgi:hypothetical protein